MKTNFLFLAVILAAFSSCTTMYKSGQTPDDVYYSPARSIDENAQREEREEPRNEQANNYDRYNSEDRMIRMGIANSRWRYLNNDFAYNPYSYNNPYNNNFAFGRNHGYYSLNNNYYNPNYNNYYYNDLNYNSYYNPYQVYLVPVTLVKPRVTTPRQINLNGYGTNYNNVNAAPIMRKSTAPAAGQTSRSYNNSNKSSGLGTILNKVFSPAPSTKTNNSYNNNTYNNSDNSPQRTYTPAPSNSSSSNSSSGSNSGSSSGGRISRPN